MLFQFYRKQACQISCFLESIFCMADDDLFHCISRDLIQEKEDQFAIADHQHISFCAGIGFNNGSSIPGGTID